MDKRGFVALETVLHVALHHGDRLLRAKDLAERQGYSERYLEQLLQQLVGAGILKSVRGPKGGYHLAKEKRHILAMDVVNAIEDNCNNSGEKTTQLYEAIVQPLQNEIDANTKQFLNDLSIQDLYDRAKDSGLLDDDTKSMVYTI